MSVRQFRPLRVDGALDSVNPVSDREPGTLIEAIDSATRWIGPRLGARQFSGVQSLGSTVLFGTHQNLITFDGTDDRIEGILAVAEQRNLGTRWTLDAVFQPHDFRATSAEETIFTYRISTTGGSEIDAIHLRLTGGADVPNQGVVKVTVKTTSSPNVVADTQTLTSTGKVTEGTDGADVSHIRVVRDRENLYLAVNNVAEASDSTLGATNAHVSDADGAWYLGFQPDETTGGDEIFKGHIYHVLLRDGAYFNMFDGMAEVLNPKSRAVKLYARGTLTNGADASRFIGNVTALGSPASAKDVTFPATFPVQGMGSFTDHNGVSWNVIEAGGGVYQNKVSS